MNFYELRKHTFIQSLQLHHIIIP